MHDQADSSRDRAGDVASPFLAFFPGSSAGPAGGHHPASSQARGKGPYRFYGRHSDRRSEDGKEDTDSSYTFGEFVLDQKLPTFLGVQERMFFFFGGVTPYVTPDNLKSGVHQAHLYDPDVNPTYCDFANHMGFAVLPARPYKSRDKASVESANGVIQRGFFQEVRNRTFYSLAELKGPPSRPVSIKRMAECEGPSRLSHPGGQELLLGSIPLRGPEGSRSAD